MQHIIRSSTLLLIAFFVCLVAPESAQAIEWGKVSPEEWAIGAPTDFPDANAIILTDSAAFNVVKWSINMDYHVRIKVLTRAGFDEIGERSITWHKKYDKLKNLKAHVITPDGKKHKVDKKSIFEKESGKWKTKTFAFPQLEPGCIVEYRYTIRSEWFSRMRSWYFQNPLYTLKSRITLSLVVGFAYDIDYQSVPSYLQTAKITERPDPNSSGGIQMIRSFAWSMENLPPITQEPYMSCENDYRSSLRFQLVEYRSQYAWKEY